MLTNQRFLLVRVSKWGTRANPLGLDHDVPVGQVRVLGWTAKRSAGLLELDAGGRRLRLHIVDKYHLQMPALLDQLGYRSPQPED